ncbi:MAG: hypothetical protein RMM53_10255, partial [Bacteroidia bacterium]|nr:hypothetical protein [Bacteroidia bacterium]
MSMIGKIRFWLATIPLVILAVGAAMHFGFRMPAHVSPSPRVGVCDSLIRDFKEQIGRVESQILQGYTGRQAEVFLIRKTISAKLRQDLNFLNNGKDNALLESIVQKAEDLGSYRNEIVGFLDSRAGPSQTDKAADTYYAKYFPLYEDLIRELKIAASKEPKPQKAAVPPALPWWPWAVAAAVAAVVCFIAARWVESAYHNPAQELADAVNAGREARNVSSPPLRTLVEAFNRRRKQEEYTVKLLEHLAAGEVEIVPEAHLIVPQAVEAVQKLHVRIADCRRNLETLRIESDVLKDEIVRLEDTGKRLAAEVERKSAELQSAMRDLAATRELVVQLKSAAETEKR